MRATHWLRSVVERERLLSVEELADWLMVPVGTIYGWRYRGDGPPSYKVGRHVRFRTKEIEEWLQSARSPGSGLVGVGELGVPGRKRARKGV